jgi:hypothetical protein
MARLVNLETLNDTNSNEFGHFSEKVGYSGGKFFAFMHPYYNDPHSGIGTAFNYPTILDFTLNSLLSKDAPLGFFEQTKDLKSGHLEQKLSMYSRSVYVAATQNGGPDLSNRSLWGSHIRTLRMAGVSEVVVGGQYLVFQDLTDVINNKPTREVQYYIQRAWKVMAEGNTKAAEWLKQTDGAVPILCAGSLMRKYLISGFDVSMSEALSPNIRVKERPKGFRHI